VDGGRQEARLLLPEVGRGQAAAKQLAGGGPPPAGGATPVEGQRQAGEQLGAVGKEEGGRITGDEAVVRAQSLVVGRGQRRSQGRLPAGRQARRQGQRAAAGDGSGPGLGEVADEENSGRGHAGRPPVGAVE
jgi:hypothetical protein